MSRVSDAVSALVHTSVQDGLINATYASPATIRHAIIYESLHSCRVALIAGLERELRRRAKSTRGGGR